AGAARQTPEADAGIPDGRRPPRAAARGAGAARERIPHAVPGADPAEWRGAAAEPRPRHRARGRDPRAGRDRAQARAPSARAEQAPRRRGDARGLPRAPPPGRAPDERRRRTARSMILRRALARLGVLTVVPAVAVAARAEDTTGRAPIPAYHGYVNDEAHVLSE